MLLAAGWVGGAPTVVAAQDVGWLQDRKRAEGSGIRLGNLELHPGVGAEFGYDSNVFLESTNVDPSPILRLTAHLLASTLGPQRMEDEPQGPEGRARRALTFRGGLSLSYYKYFFEKLRDNVEGNLGLDLTINPDGLFVVGLSENFARTIRPFADEGAAGRTYARNLNDAGVRFSLQSRQGILRASLGYRLRYEFFDSSSFQPFNNLQHLVQANFAWRFFPYTAALYQGELLVQRYPNASSAPALLGPGLLTRHLVGLSGALSATWGLTAMVGYAAGLFEVVDSRDDVIGRLELRYQPKPHLRWAVGYDRWIRPSFLGNYIFSDRGYTNFLILIGGVALVGIEASAGYERTATVLARTDMAPLGSAARRAGMVLRAKLFGEYRIRDWLGVNLTVGYVADTTDYTYRSLPGYTLPDPPGNYQRFDVWGGVRAFY